MRSSRVADRAALGTRPPLPASSSIHREYTKGGAFSIILMVGEQQGGEGSGCGGPAGRDRVGAGRWVMPHGRHYIA